jgi:23S rRNA pseudouridine2605 synthase
VIHEGRNRQVRKMCDAIGHPVVQLKRVRLGPIADDRLKPGYFRSLTPGEVAALKKGAPGPEFKRPRPSAARVAAQASGGGPREK